MGLEAAYQVFHSTVKPGVLQMSLAATYCMHLDKPCDVWRCVGARDAWNMRNLLNIRDLLIKDVVLLI